jgi:UDP-N-acetylglucosamine acyltransferase
MAVPTIHPTATIEGDVELADDVLLGPRCTITGPVKIGAGTRAIGDVWIHGPTTIGEGNIIYPYTTIGFAPQARNYDVSESGPGVLIGNRNTLREHVTVNRAMTDTRPTTIGDDNYIMAQCHAGHDVVIGNNTTLANSVHLGGHAVIEDLATLGGASNVHQFVRIGHGAMLSGAVGTTRDVLPWFTVTATNVAASLNLVGMRRQGLTSDEIDSVRWVFKTINRRGLSLPAAIEEVRIRHNGGEQPVLGRLLDFLESAERPICTAFNRAARSGYEVNKT